MTSKPAQNRHINFICSGTKNSAFRTKDSVTSACDTACIMNVIKLNFPASHDVNFEKIREIILRRDTAETVTVHNEKHINCKRCEDGVASLQNLSTRSKVCPL
jgi:hypothetical protein